MDSSSEDETAALDEDWDDPQDARSARTENKNNALDNFIKITASLEGYGHTLINYYYHRKE